MSKFSFNPLTSQFDLVNPTTSGGTSNSFTTIATPSGTSPVASSPTDTLTYTSTDSTVNITGNAGSDTIDVTLANAYKQEKFTLSPGDITNGYVVLAAAPKTATSTRLTVIGGPEQDYAVDFQILLSTHLDWNGLTLASVLATGDKIIVSYN